MRILTIGGTALLGPHVLRALSGQDWITQQDRSAGQDEIAVWTLTRTGRPYYCEDALKGDRDDPGALRTALQAAQPHLILDMVPFTRLNANGLARACADRRATAFQPLTSA